MQLSPDLLSPTKLKTIKRQTNPVNTVPAVTFTANMSSSYPNDHNDAPPADDANGQPDPNAETETGNINSKHEPLPPDSTMTPRATRIHLARRPAPQSRPSLPSPLPIYGSGSESPGTPAPFSGGTEVATSASSNGSNPAANFDDLDPALWGISEVSAPNHESFEGFVRGDNGAPGRDVGQTPVLNPANLGLNNAANPRRRYDIVRASLQQELDEGNIRPSSSPWGFDP